MVNYLVFIFIFVHTITYSQLSINNNYIPLEVESRNHFFPYVSEIVQIDDGVLLYGNPFWPGAEQPFIARLSEESIEARFYEFSGNNNGKIAAAIHNYEMGNYILSVTGDFDTNQENFWYFSKINEDLSVDYSRQISAGVNFSITDSGDLSFHNNNIVVALPWSDRSIVVYVFNANGGIVKSTIVKIDNTVTNPIFTIVESVFAFEDNIIVTVGSGTSYQEIEYSTIELSFEDLSVQSYNKFVQDSKLKVRAIFSNGDRLVSNDGFGGVHKLARLSQDNDIKWTKVFDYTKSMLGN